MIRISSTQLFSIIMLFQIGTTPLFALGIRAKQDAWIAILISMLGGFAMLWVWLGIQKHYPDKNWAEILIELLGKWLGIPLVLLYAMYWNHIACFNLREFGDLMLLTSLPNTPISVVLAVYVFVSVYIILLGLEVFGRTCEVTLPYILFFIIFTYVMIYLSGEMKFDQLLPVLGEGIMPVLKAAHPQVLTFPFGEAAVLLMYWKYVHPKESIRKVSYFAIGISGLLLIVSLITIISVLGVEYASNATVPLLIIIRLINIGDILTHLDVIGTIIIFIGALFKMTVLFYAAVLAICTIFHIKNERWVILGLGLFNVIYCTVYFTSMSYHRYTGQEPFTFYVQPIFGWTLPSMILIILWLKKWSQKINGT